MRRAESTVSHDAAPAARDPGVGIWRRLVRGTSWSAVNVAATRLINLGTGVLLARALGRVEYGKLGIVQSTVGMFAMFAALGTSVTATKYVAEHRVSDPARAGRMIGFAELVSMVSALVFVAAFVIASGWLAAETLNAPEMAPLLVAGSGLVLFGAVAGATSGALAGLEAFSHIALLDIVGAALQCGLALSGLRLAGVRGALVGMVAANAVQCAAYFAVLRVVARRAGVPISHQRTRDEWQVMWRFSLPALLAATAGVAVNWACNALVVRLPDGMGQFGVYNAANQWRTVIMFIPSTLSTALLPILASMSGKRDRRRGRILAVSIAINATVAILVALGVCLFAPLILRVYGREFVGGRMVLVLLSGAAVLAATTAVVGQALTSAGRMWVGFVLNAIWGAVLIGATFALRGRGAAGLAGAQLVAYFVHLLTVSTVVVLSLRAERSDVRAAEASVNSVERGP
jgi:O-antigen/teichoic acid export membrane protein